YRNVVGIFMNQLMQGNSLTVFGDGGQTRAFSYITDVSPIIARSVDVPEAYNEVFNLGADKEYTVKELAETTIEVMGMDEPLKYLPARNEVVHAFADHSKVKRVFGVGGFTSLEDGLKDMADWAKFVGARESSVFDNIEITEKLPSIWVTKSLDA
ncbi:MAG: UDP-glucose 4-epimerase, partial [Crocinitomicaceae bacterium]|nr:UDP-glucose 4-epimerase [Crocinitomicaceae bacterium]